MCNFTVAEVSREKEESGDFRLQTVKEVINSFKSRG
jgi:hypothetical protein